MWNKQHQNSEPLLLEQALERAVSFLERHGVAQPRLEAQVLLAHLLAAQRVEILTHPERLLTAVQAAAYGAALEKRATGYPLQYLTGGQEFMSLDFRVNEAVLIPRADTEVLVEKVLALRQESLRSSRNLQLVDVGTGSGAIAVSLAHYWPELQVTAADLSAAALAVARDNARRHGVTVEFVQGDLLTPFLAGGRRFDLIVSNPPYIPTGELAALAPEVRREPVSALDGGPDGLAYYRRLAEQAAACLNPGGSLALEIGWQQGEAVRALLAERGYGQIAVERDYAGRQRVVWATMQQYR